jgi:hypothetical protein
LKAINPARRNSMRTRLSKWLGIVLALSAAVATRPAPHEVTYLGTVRAVAERSLEMMVVDERTQAESPMTFGISADTKFYRGEHAMTSTDVAIMMGERCAVTINREVAGTTALTVRLADHEHE